MLVRKHLMSLCLAGSAALMVSSWHGISSLHAQPKKPDYSRFLKIKKWTGKVTVAITYAGPQFANPKFQENMGKPMLKIRRMMIVRGLLVIEDPEATAPTWRTDIDGGKVSGSATIDETTTRTMVDFVTGAKVPAIHTRKGSNSLSQNPDDPNFGGMSLTIDPEEGIYYGGGGGSLEVKDRDVGGTGDPQDDVDSVSEGIPHQPLPATGLVLAGTRNFRFNDISVVHDGEEKEAAEAFKKGQVPFDPNQLDKAVDSSVGERLIYGTITWSFKPGEKQELEAVITSPPGYQTWLPKAGENDNPGNTMTVQARLRVPNKPNEKVGQQAKWTWELVDTSKEKGICLNYPPPAKAQSTLDAKFDPNDQDLDVSSDGQKTTSKQKSTTGSATVLTYDYGAYTRLRVTAEVGGEKFEAEIEDMPGKTELSIPFDENHNHVADGWESDLSHDAQWTRNHNPPSRVRTATASRFMKSIADFFWPTAGIDA